MCTVCGCGEPDHDHSHPNQGHHHHHHAEDGHDHDHDHDHGTSHPYVRSAGHHHYGLGAAGVSLPGFGQERIVRIERDVLAKNDGYARDNRSFFEQHGILVLNLLSAPGSGKTTLLERTLTDLRTECDLVVIEGDQQTANDAERIRGTGVRAVQVNTGKGCHLDAHQVGHAVAELRPADHGILFIENVGNLVCPAMFDLGEAAKVVMLSVTEGEDKPIKYPDMFNRADVILLNKIDLQPYLRFDVDRCLEEVRKVNRDAPVFSVSAMTGQGLTEWYQWLRDRRKALLTARAARLESELAALRAEI